MSAPTTEMSVTVNGTMSSYRMTELCEDLEKCKMHLGFEKLDGELPPFGVDDMIDLAYTLYAVDWKTTQAKVVSLSGNRFNVVIEFKDLLRKFHDPDQYREHEDFQKIVTD